MMFSSIVAAIVSATIVFVASQNLEHQVTVPNLVSTGVMIPDTPVPTATPTAVPLTPTPIPQSWNCTGNWQVDRWGPLVASVFPEWAVCEALFIIQHESNGDPNVWNFQGSGACGLFQLLPCESTDPYLNTLGAHRKWLDGGQDFWKHWRRWW